MRGKYPERQRDFSIVPGGELHVWNGLNEMIVADPYRYVVERGTVVNGVKVFHNDIASITDPYIKELSEDERELGETLLKRKYRIVWTGISFVVEIIHKDPNAGIMRFGFPKDGIIEVIGNIRDNKEV